MVRSKSSVKYYAKQIKHIIMRKGVVYLGMIWCNDIMSLNTSDEGYNDGKKYGQKGAICGPNNAIISSLCHVRACSSNRLIGSSAPSFLFSSAIEGFLGVRERFSSRETSSRPNLIYSDLIGDMH
jgi:hypothetical protein